MPECSPNLLSQKLITNPDASLVLISPDIPFSKEDAFYPFRRDPSDGKIKPSYQYRECVKKILWCTKWATKTIFFSDLEWFLANSMGVSKPNNLNK